MHTELLRKKEDSMGKAIQRYLPGEELRKLGAFSVSPKVASSKGQSSANLSLLAKPGTNEQVKVQPASRA